MTVELEKKWEAQDLTGCVGKHIIYTYENGWQYEIYVKNATTLDYRIHSGMVANRWVKNQTVNIVQLSGEKRYKLSWAEPTGTAVSVVVNLDSRRQYHGAIFFPRWIATPGAAAKTTVFQNEHLDEMRILRNTGPTYPIFLVDKFAEIMFEEDGGVDNEKLISISPREFAPTLDRIKAASTLEGPFGQLWGRRDPNGLVGKRVVYTYQNGWDHEIYFRSESKIDYQIHSGLGPCGYVKGQEAVIGRLVGSNRYIISWTDLTGTSVSLTVELDKLHIHGVLFFPQWVLTRHTEVVEFTNAELDVDLITAQRDAGPTYPLHIVSEFAEITDVKDCGTENHSILVPTRVSAQIKAA